jgi:hypothetical protein
VSPTPGYAYNLADGLTSEAYPSGRVVNTSFDGANRTSLLKSTLGTTHTYLTMPGSGATPPYGYAAQGEFGSLPLGNGLTRTFTFNSRLQTTGISDTTGATYPLLNLSYTWGTTADNGNLLTEAFTTSATGSTQGPSFSQTFGYDHVNRLSTSSETGTGTGWTQNYSFDAYGNVWKTTSTNTPPDSIPVSNRCQDK